MSVMTSDAWPHNVVFGRAACPSESTGQKREKKYSLHFERKTIFCFSLFLFFIGVCQGCKPGPSASESRGGADPATGPFAPMFQSNLTDAYPDAHKIYNSAAPAPQGVYRHSGLIFVIVVIDTNREHLDYLEGTAMLRTTALLWDAFPALPRHFKVRNRVVEKALDDNTGIYRYAVVYREQDINRKLKEQNKISTSNR